jgi:hypothetical protein
MNFSRRKTPQLWVVGRDLVMVNSFDEWSPLMEAVLGSPLNSSFQ